MSIGHLYMPLFCGSTRLVLLSSKLRLSLTFWLLNYYSGIDGTIRMSVGRLVETNLMLRHSTKLVHHPASVRTTSIMADG